MATYQSRISALAGVFPDQGALQQWLKEGFRTVVQALPDHLYWVVMREGEDSGGGVAIAGTQVLYAHVGGRRARLVPASMKGAYTDDGSIHRATDLSPVFWMENGRVYVMGSAAGGRVAYLYIPSPELTDEETKGFPTDLDHLAVLYAAARQKMAQAARLIAPIPPEAPTISYQDAQAVAPSATQLGTLPAVPTMDQVSAGKPTLSVVLGSFTISDLDEPTPDAGMGDIPTLPAAPTLTLPELELDFTEYLQYYAEEDVEMMRVALEKIQTGLHKHQTLLSKYSTEVEAWATTVRTTLEKAGIETDVFSKKLEAYIGQINARIAAYTAELDAKVKEYTAKGDIESRFYQIAVEAARYALEGRITAYQGQVQALIEQARVASQEAITHAQNATSVAIQNAAQRVAAKVEDYRVKLEAFNAKLAAYQAERAAHLEDAKLLWEQYATGLQTFITGYQA